MSEAELLKRRKAGVDLAIDKHYFSMDDGNIRATQPFLECFRKHWRVDSPMCSEEIVYRAMLVIREFSPGLGESDFLALRRLIWQFSYGEHDGWWKNHPKKEVPAEETLRKLDEIKETWVKGLGPDEKKDALTSAADMQQANATKVVAEGKNFMPELLMWRGRNLGVSFIGPPDPMAQAIAAVKQSMPDGYSFAAEAWRASLSLLKPGHKWGDMEKLDVKTEAFMQVVAENDGPYFQREFIIDRTRATLVRQSTESESRMPRLWGLDSGRSEPPTASSPYA